MVLRSFDYFFIETLLFFQKKTETLTALTIPKQYYALKPVVVKTLPNLVNFETFKYFWKENFRLFQENTFFECYEGTQPKRPLGTLLNKTKPRAAALRKLMSLFEKKPATFTRKSKFWTCSFWDFSNKSNTWNAS